MAAIPALLENMGHLAELSARNVITAKHNKQRFLRADVEPRNWHLVQLESMRGLAYEMVAT